jgi:tripartite-type tricarboxylate transporter receptor subunit TctC
LAIGFKRRASYAAPVHMIHCAMDTRRRAWLAHALLVSTALAAPRGAAHGAQAPLRLVVSGAAGSPPDALARILAEPLGAGGRPVVVDARPGGGGALAVGAVARAAPDGHTLAIVGWRQLVAPARRSASAPDSAGALVPVSALVWTANVLVVSAASPLRWAAELVAQAKANPGAWSYASAGTGTASHMAAELFKHGARIDVQHVPFKGAPSALTALIGDQVQFAFAGVAAALPLIRSGKLRALGTAGSARLPALPDVPTLSELGLADVRLNEQFCVAAPPATPPALIAALAREFARVIALPQTRARLEQLGLYPVEAGGPDALVASLRDDGPRWQRIMRELGIRAE